MTTHGHTGDVYDCIIVGGGPAGLTATTYLSRYYRTVLVLDADNSRASYIPLSHNAPGFPAGVTGNELLRRLRDQSGRYGARVEHAQVVSLRRLPVEEGEARMEAAAAHHASRGDNPAVHAADNNQAAATSPQAEETGSRKSWPAGCVFEVVSEPLLGGLRGRHGDADPDRGVRPGGPDEGAGQQNPQTTGEGSPSTRAKQAEQQCQAQPGLCDIRYARFIMLATGVDDREPELPDIKDAVHRGLLRHCPICDGYEQRGKRVGVIGWDEAAAGEAVFISHFARDTTLLSLGKPLARPPDALRCAGVKVVEAPVVHVECVETEGQQEAGDGVKEGSRHAGGSASSEGGHPTCGGSATGIDVSCARDEVMGSDASHALRFHLLDGSVLQLDTVYSALGIRPRTDLARQLGLRPDSFCRDGRITVADCHNATSVDGVYAIGDVTEGLNQLVGAYAGAAAAATDVHRRLLAAHSQWQQECGQPAVEAQPGK